MTVSFDASEAAKLPPGDHDANITFRNRTNGNVTGQSSVSVRLTVEVTQTKGVLNVSTNSGGNLDATLRDGSLSNGVTSVTISNPGANVQDVQWDVTGIPSWVDVSPSSGTLEGGDTGRVTISVDRSEAASMSQGAHSGTISFNNRSGSGVRGDTGMLVSLTVVNTAPQEEEDQSEEFNVENFRHQGQVEGTDARYFVDVLPDPDNPNISFVEIFIHDADGLADGEMGSVTLIIPESAIVIYNQIKKYLTPRHTSSLTEWTLEAEIVSMAINTALWTTFKEIGEVLVGLIHPVVHAGLVGEPYLREKAQAVLAIVNAYEFAADEVQAMNLGQDSDNCTDKFTVGWYILDNPGVGHIKGVRISIPVVNLSEDDYLSVAGRVRTYPETWRYVRRLEDGSFKVDDVLNSGASMSYSGDRPSCNPSADEPPPNYVAWHSDAMGLAYTTSGRGGRVTVTVKTLEKGTTATAPRISIAGPGASQTRTASAPVTALSGGQGSRTWRASFDVPVNVSNTERVYTITAASSQIEGDRASRLVIAPDPQAPANAVSWHSDAMGLAYSASSGGGRVTVTVKTLESSMTASAPRISIAGPGATQTRTASAAGSRQSGGQRSRTWRASFDIPVNDSSSERMYTITATSSQIEGNRASRLVIAPVTQPPAQANAVAWHSDPMEFSHGDSDDGGSVVTVSIRTLESGMTASAPGFSITGPGLSMTQTATAAGTRRAGDQRQRTWETSVEIPASLLANLSSFFSGEAYVPYTVTATSDQIEGDRKSQLIIVVPAISSDEE